MPPANIVFGWLAQIEDALGDAIAGAKHADALAPLTVLVDNSLLKQQLPRAFARRGAPQINVRYFRPDELARALAAQAPDGASSPRLTRDAERFLVREIAAGAGGYFAGIAGREGFADALGRLFRELEMGSFAGGSLPRALGLDSADAWADQSSKFGQIARLFAEYLRRRGEFAGRADAYAAARAARLDGPLFVYGVWSPSEVQAALIEHIASYADVTVFLPQTGTPADDAHKALRERLIASGATTEVLPSSIQAPTSSLTPFTPSTPETQLISAPDTVREVWEAARWCLDRARAGVAFHEMAVVYRNQDPYRALVDEIFSEAKIETYLHDGRLLSAHPFGRRLLALLELAASYEQFERARVMEFLTETRLPRATRERYEDRENRIFVRPSEWEAYTREAGVVEGAAQWQERLRRLAEQKRDEARNEGWEWLADVAVRIEALARFAADFHTALAEHPDVATWDEHLAYARSLAQRYAADTGEILEALVDLSMLSAVRERVTFAEFCRAVRDDLDWRDTSNVLKEPVRQFGRRGVAVFDASSLRHLRFRAVYLLGVSERAWPPPPRPDPLLLEHERRALNAAGAGTLPLRTEPDAETLNFALALQSATERLALSYARADAGRSGKHLPSYFFRSVAESLEGVRLTLEDLEFSARVRRIEAGRLAVDEIGASLSRAEYDRGLVRRATLGIEPAAIAALGEDAPSFAAAVAARRDRWSAALTPYDGVMRSEQSIAAAGARSPFARGDAVSASRLEMYATCPYRYFLRYGLGIEPVEEPEAIERMDHLQRGTLIHEILQRFLARIGRDDPPRADRRAEHMRILYEIAREAGEERVRRGVTGRPLIWAMDKRAIDEDLDRWYGYEVREIADSGLLPGAFEARFGKVMYGLGDEDETLSDDEPLALDAAGREIKLLGRIDRIDWDAAGGRFRVIDYKTGKFGGKKGTFDRGEALQLPIYLHAAARMLGLVPAQGDAQYFYATSRGEFRRHTITGPELEAARGAFDQVLTTIAAGVDKGFFAPNPEHNHCMWCDYKDVCDVRIGRIMQGKRADARGGAYLALEEIS
jgi:ATP-dependent helicase/nuclease subunit B